MTARQTSTQQLMVWGLRALVLWVAFEVGAAVFDQATHARELEQQAGSHAAAMARLSRRAQDAEAAAKAEEATLLAGRKVSGAGALTVPKGYKVEDAISVVLRKDLTASGARSPQVTTTVTPAGAGFYRAVVDARWEEAATGSPGALAALAGNRPYLGVSRLTLALQGAGTVSVGVQLKFSFQIQGDAAATDSKPAAVRRPDTSAGSEERSRP